MRCIDDLKNKWYFKKKDYVRSIAAVTVAAVFFCSGCGTEEYELQQPYDVYGTQLHYQTSEETDAGGSTTGDKPAFFAQDLCVGEDVEKGTENSAYVQAAEAAGVFRPSSREITYSKNIYEKLYPASTTKILTAYLALKYGKLEDIVTVSANAADQAIDSSVCGIRAGDQMTLEQLLYGLLLKSGNDAADAIAEHISGDTQKFAGLMNEEAAALGATHSHFVNPHGLQDEDHYTCVYDLYLLFQAALEHEEFKKIIQTPNYTATYKDSNGAQVTQEWLSTDRYINGEVQAPEGIHVVGGKTGTTNAAGYCLVLFSEDRAGEPVISIVMKAESRDSLYLYMSELLS